MNTNRRVVMLENKINVVSLGLIASMAIIYSSCTKKNTDMWVGKWEKLTQEESNKIMADSTGGASYTVKGDVGQFIQDKLEDINEPVDVSILIDNTGSMTDDVNEVNANVNNIIAALYPGSRLGAATYNDNNDDPIRWYEWEDLNLDHSKARSFLAAIDHWGGGSRESTYDGIWETVDRSSWQLPKRMIFVLGDVPPLYGAKSRNQIEDVIEICQLHNVELHMIML